MPVDTEGSLRGVRFFLDNPIPIFFKDSFFLSTAGTQIGEIKKKNSIFLTLPELLRADSSESQGLVRGVVSRRHKSCKWKRGQHRKDMGDVNWHVPIDAERALEVRDRCFLPLFVFKRVVDADY